MTLAKRFGLAEGREFYISSNLDLKNRRDARIIEMCELLGADTYYSGVAAKDYHIEQDYADRGIGLMYSDYQSITYKQANGPKDEFVCNMSVIDYIMNCGFVLPRGWKRHE